MIQRKFSERPMHQTKTDFSIQVTFSHVSETFTVFRKTDFKRNRLSHGIFFFILKGRTDKLLHKLSSLEHLNRLRLKRHWSAVCKRLDSRLFLSFNPLSGASSLFLLIFAVLMGLPKLCMFPCSREKWGVQSRRYRLGLQR